MRSVAIYTIDPVLTFPARLYEAKITPLGEILD